MSSDICTSKVQAVVLCVNAESAHQKGATDQVEAMARDLEYTRAELASAKQNLDKAHSDQFKVRLPPLTGSQSSVAQASGCECEEDVSSAVLNDISSALLTGIC